MTQAGMAPTPSSENGPAAPELAADAHGCIMVRVGIRPPEYKSVGAICLAPIGEFPSVHPRKRDCHDCQ